MMEWNEPFPLWVRVRESPTEKWGCRSVSNCIFICTASVCTNISSWHDQNENISFRPLINMISRRNFLDRSIIHDQRLNVRCAENRICLHATMNDERHCSSLVSSQSQHFTRLTCASFAQGFSPIRFDFNSTLYLFVIVLANLRDG